jgi:RNA polymerase sigma-70 factor (ECF subfamily)
MTTTPPVDVLSRELLSDEQVVERVLEGDTALFEIIIRRHNQRLYRVARAITRDDAQAEDVMQAAYVRAYEHLRQFGGRAAFAAWLIRIAVNEALSRLRDRKHYDHEQGEGDRMDRFPSRAPDPEQAATAAETRRLLEVAIEGLPDGNRSVFVLRDVEGMSTLETSEALGISEENVKVRLHRARLTLRRAMTMRTNCAASEAFTFHAVRCDRVVKSVFNRIQDLAFRGDTQM